MMKSQENIKLLIVDDEEFMREGLKVYLDWEQYSINEILVAEDGVDALEIVEKEQPHLVITDIKMPEMSGLELISRIKKILPECICIVISGYNDFLFAKKSIDLGVFSYIMKPIELEELKTVIASAADIIQKKMQENERKMLLNGNGGEQKTDIQRGILKKIIYEKDPAVREELIASLDTGGAPFLFPHYVVCVVKLSGKRFLSTEWSMKLFPIVEQKINGNCAEDETENAICLLEREFIAVLFGYYEMEKMIRQSNEIFVEFFQTITKCFDLSLVTVQGRPITKLTDLYPSFCEVLRCCSYRSFFNDNGFFMLPHEEEIVRKNENELVLLSSGIKDRFLLAFEANDIEGIKSLLEEQRRYAERSYYQDKNILFSFILEMMITAIRLLDSKKIKVEQYISMEHISSGFFEKFDNVDQMTVWLLNQFKILAEAYSNHKFSLSENQLIEQIKLYVQENYNKDINLNNVADYIKYNSNYIGRIFKKNEKVKFSDYLNQLRIEKVCIQLKTTNQSISQIAYQNGYNDCQYFMKVFKTKMGITPRKYRITHKIGRDEEENA